MAPAWSIKYFQYEDGGTPFEDFIPRLTRHQRVECYSIIQLLKKWGDTLEGEQCLTHACGRQELKEYRGDSLRVFYICDSESLEIIIVDCLFPGENGDLLEAICRKVE